MAAYSEYSVHTTAHLQHSMTLHVFSRSITLGPKLSSLVYHKGNRCGPVLFLASTLFQVDLTNHFVQQESRSGTDSLPKFMTLPEVWTQQKYSMSFIGPEIVFVCPQVLLLSRTSNNHERSPPYPSPPSPSPLPQGPRHDRQGHTGLVELTSLRGLLNWIRLSFRLVSGPSTRHFCSL